MAAVLVDGNPAAMRALELGTMPGLIGAHETTQVVLLHAWTEAKDVAAISAIPQTIDAINKSRAAQFTLNYKLESLKLSAVAGGHSQITAAAAGDTTVSAAVSPTPTSGSTPAPGDKPKAAAAAAGKKGAAAVAEGAASPTTSAAPQSKTERTPDEFASALCAYAASRCDHHGIHHIFLGAGNSTQGKGISVGSVARAMVRTGRSQHDRFLYFLKTSGPVVRLNAGLRILVLIVPGVTDLEHLRRVLRVCNGNTVRSDRVGVVIVANNGKPKPDTNTVSVVEPAADDASVVGKACAAILAEHGLSDAPEHGAVSSVANETFPLLSYLTLDPTNQLPTPVVDDVPNQVTKFFSSIKVDFVALPPVTTVPGSAVTCFGDALVAACLAAPKPHTLLL